MISFQRSHFLFLFFEQLIILKLKAHFLFLIFKKKHFGESYRFKRKAKSSFCHESSATLYIYTIFIFMWTLEL